MARTDRLLVDVLGRRRLDQNAVDGGVAVELLHHRSNSACVVSGGQFQFDRVHADLLAHAVLGADVGTRRGIVAHEHDGQAGRVARAISASAICAAQFFENFVGDGDAV